MDSIFRCRFILTALWLLIGTQALWAAGLTRSPLQSVTVEKKTVPPTQLHPASAGSRALSPTVTPDLLVQSAQWSAPPAAGQKLGLSSILNIAIRNAGTAPAAATQIQIRCEALAGGPCPAGLSDSLPVPQLAANQSHGMAWPAMSSSAWTAGKYRLALTIDPQNQVPESNDLNNRLTLNVDIAAPVPAVIVPSPVKIEAKTQQPSAESFSPGAGNNRRGAIQPAAPSTAAFGQIVPMDVAIQSLRHEPQDPRLDESVKLLARIENRTDQITYPWIYARCKPLDGGTCPGGGPGREVVDSSRERLLGNEAQDVTILPRGGFKGTGRFLISVAKDAVFSKGLLIDMVHVSPPEDVNPAIRQLCYDLSGNEPCARMVETAGQVKSMKIEARGAGFNAETKLFCRYNGTGGKTTDLGAKFSGGPSAGSLRAVVPENVVTIFGQYLIWAKNADGKESNSEPLEIVQPGKPPQIFAWDPRTISTWSRLDNHQPTLYVRLKFQGKNLGPLTDVWVDPSPVAPDLKAKVDDDVVPVDSQLVVRLTTVRPTDGEIKLWIYNKHPDGKTDTRNQAQWFKIPVKLELVPLPPPALVTPKEGESYVARDVELTFQGQMPYVLDLQWQQLAGPVWLPVKVVEQFDTGGGSQRKLTVKRNLLPNDGTYRLRARVSPDDDDNFGRDYVWGEWRRFDFKKN